MRRLMGVLVVLGTVLAARPACAQVSQPTRPYRGLFGGGVGNTDQLLTLTMSFLGGYDSNVEATFMPLPDTATGSTSLASELQTVKTGFEQASANLAYSLSRSRVAFTASGFAAGTYYQVLSSAVESTTVAPSVRRLPPRPRTNLSASEIVSTYQPFVAFSERFSGRRHTNHRTTGYSRHDGWRPPGQLRHSERHGDLRSRKLSRRVDVSLALNQRAENTFRVGRRRLRDPDAVRTCRASR